MIPCLSDNYCYYVFDDETTFSGFLIDVGDDAIIDYLVSAGIRPTAIFSTHRHSDHAGGNKYALQTFPNVLIYGYHDEQVDSCTNVVYDQDIIEVGTFKV